MNLNKIFDKKIEEILKGKNFEKYAGGFNKKGFYTIDQFKAMKQHEIHQLVEKIADEKDVYNISELLHKETQSRFGKIVILFFVYFAILVYVLTLFV